MALDYLQVSHDSFARQSLVKREVDACGRTCQWCGRIRRNGKLYQYGTERDDRPGLHNIAWHGGLFCIKVCHDSYHS